MCTVSVVVVGGGGVNGYNGSGGGVSGRCVSSIGDGGRGMERTASIKLVQVVFIPVISR